MYLVHSEKRCWGLERSPSWVCVLDLPESNKLNRWRPGCEGPSNMSAEEGGGRFTGPVWRTELSQRSPEPWLCFFLLSSLRKWGSLCTFLITIGSSGVQKVPRNLEPSPHTDHWCRATSRQWSRRGFFIFCLFVSGVLGQVVPQIWNVSLYKLQAESWICFLIEFSLIEWVCSCNFSVRVVLLTCGCCFVCFWVLLQFEAPVSDMQDNNTKQK